MNVILDRGASADRGDLADEGEERSGAERLLLHTATALGDLEEGIAGIGESDVGDEGERTKLRNGCEELV